MPSAALIAGAIWTSTMSSQALDQLLVGDDLVHDHDEQRGPSSLADTPAGPFLIGGDERVRKGRSSLAANT